MQRREADANGSTKTKLSEPTEEVLPPSRRQSPRLAAVETAAVEPEEKEIPPKKVASKSTASSIKTAAKAKKGTQQMAVKVTKEESDDEPSGPTITQWLADARLSDYEGALLGLGVEQVSACP